MLKYEQLHDYQKKAINHQCMHPNSMLWLDMGLGKEQPVSEPVLTPDGWKPIGDIRIGDQVIGSNGRPITVMGVFPQGNKPVVELTFSDGGKCRAGWDHLWAVRDANRVKRGNDHVVLTTRQLVEKGLTFNNHNKPTPKWYVPLVKPIEFAEKQLPVEPYLLGVILGDGTVTLGGSVSVCTDKEIIESCGLNYLRDHECEYVGYASFLKSGRAMIELGLNGKRSWEKFIPEIYFTASPGQRLALLQGLLDTDGSPITAGGGIEFSSTSEQLIDGVVTLVRSFGGVAKKSNSRITRHQNGNGRPSWRVNVKLPPELDPFRLSRKLEKWIRPTKYKPIRKIVEVKEIGYEQSVCIMVDAPDHLYVTCDYVVTHNTATTLTSIKFLTQTGYLKSILIVAPIRVCRMVWKQEAVKWEHTKDLTFSMIVGNRDQRTKALLRPANIYITNFENLQWLAETLDTYFIGKGKEIPFDGLVIDEISKMKNSTTKRVAAWKKLFPHWKWTTGLTGTPASNGYKDLHGQYLVIDGGQRLGTSKTAFKTRFYYKRGFKEFAFEDTESTIKNLIGDITLEMSAEDYNPLPDLIVNDVVVEFTPELRERYEQMEKDFFLRMDSGTEKEMFNQAALTNTCLQFSNGAVYPVAGMPLWEKIHDLKLDALEEIIDEVQGNPVLCSYAYRSDAERIMERFKHLQPINLTDCKSDKSLNDAMSRWATGDCVLMIGHPASMGHGIDSLQRRGNTLVWFGLNWSLDLYEQFNARIRRQGQGKPVMCHRIITKDTLDQAQALALDDKATTQSSLRNAVKTYRQQKGV